MKEDENELAQKINSLHSEAEAHLRASKQASVQIGEKLFQKKQEIPQQREFAAWIRGNLDFNTAMAYRYLAVFQKAEMKQFSGFDF